jgi:hypothetical protein
MVARVAVLCIAAAVLVACSSSGNGRAGKATVSARPSFRQCVQAWNGQANRARRALVADVFVPAGYTRAGIQMSITGGIPGQPDPNPLGCRVVFFRQDRWVAYLAQRDGDHFRFRAKRPPGRRSDQRGAWPKSAKRVPNNARIIAGGKLSLRA